MDEKAVLKRLNRILAKADMARSMAKSSKTELLMIGVMAGIELAADEIEGVKRDDANRFLDNLATRARLENQAA